MCYISSQAEEAMGDGRSEKSSTNVHGLVLYRYYSTEHWLHWQMTPDFHWNELGRMRFCVHGETSIFYIPREIRSSRDPILYVQFWGGVGGWRSLSPLWEVVRHTTLFLTETTYLKKQNIPWGPVGEWVETIQIKCHGLQLLQSLWQKDVQKKHPVWGLHQTSDSTFLSLMTMVASWQQILQNCDFPPVCFFLLVCFLFGVTSAWSGLQLKLKNGGRLPVCLQTWACSL